MSNKYLNPKDTPKEVWLFDNGFMIPNPCDLSNRTRDPESLETLANQIVDSLVAGAKLKPRSMFDPEEKGDDAFFNHYVIVDMVNNGKFRAAAVYASRNEMLMVYNDREGMLVGDERQRLWFIVDREKALAEVRPF